jgi:hypothetical protein
VPKLASTAKGKVGDQVAGLRQRNGHKKQDGDADSNGRVAAADRRHD